MSDVNLIDACLNVLRGHATCEAMERKFAGRSMSEGAAREVHEIVTAAHIEMSYIESTPATSLAGCRAKASVLAAIEHEGIALSLGRDVLANVPEENQGADLASLFALNEIG